MTTRHPQTASDVAALAGARRHDQLAPPTPGRLWFVAYMAEGGDCVVAGPCRDTEISPSTLVLWRELYARGKRGLIDKMGLRSAPAAGRPARRSPVEPETIVEPAVIDAPARVTL